MDHHQLMAGIHMSRFEAMRAEYMARFLVWVSVTTDTPQTAWETTFPDCPMGTSCQNALPGVLTSSDLLVPPPLMAAGRLAGKKKPGGEPGHEVSR